MPFARLTLVPAMPPETMQRLATSLTKLIARDLGKRHDLTSVLIETPGMFQWTIGASESKCAAHLEVCVTAGTNSADEKQSFIGSAMLLLRQELPDLAVATYIIVKELAADDWGYDGRTQGDRAGSKNPGPT
jgi:4-oxalocrotonate tautomerase